MRRKGLGVGLSRRGGPRLLVFDVFNVSVNVFNVVVHGVEMLEFLIQTDRENGGNCSVD